MSIPSPLIVFCLEVPCVAEDITQLHLTLSQTVLTLTFHLTTRRISTIGFVRLAHLILTYLF